MSAGRSHQEAQLPRLQVGIQHLLVSWSSARQPLCRVMHPRSLSRQHPIPSVYIIVIIISRFIRVQPSEQHGSSALNNQTHESVGSELQPQLARSCTDLLCSSGGMCSHATAHCSACPASASCTAAWGVRRSRAQSFEGVPGLQGLQAWEGIIPGLDFCNHAQFAPCRWAVDPPSNTHSPTVRPHLASARYVTSRAYHMTAACTARPAAAVTASVP